MQDDFYLVEREAILRRQADEEYARRWRLAKLSQPRLHSWLRFRARLSALASSASERIGELLAWPSEPQEQCC